MKSFKAQVRRWSREENRGYLVQVDVVEEANKVSVFLNGIRLVAGSNTVEDALQTAETLIRERRLNN